MKTLILSLNVFLMIHGSANAAGSSREELSGLQLRIARLEAGILGAEAIRAVKRLQHAYGHYAELGLWQDLADLFAEEGVGHYPSGTLHRDGIRRLFLQDIGKGALGLPEGLFYPHLMLQPVVTVAADQKTAKARWHVFAMLGSYGGTAVWAGGIYENSYVLENGAWKISDLNYYPRYHGSYEQSGWTVDNGAVPAPPNPATAGRPIAAIPEPSRAKASMEFGALSRRLAALQQRAQSLSDENEVENLQHIYGYYVDRKMWDDVADLFAEDATLELGLQGVYAGKASIRRALNQFGPAGLGEGELNDHLMLQTIVHVAPDGRTARIRASELVLSGKNGVGGEWGEGIFENSCVKRNGVWRIQSLHYYPRMLTDYDKGWAKDARPAPGPSRDFPPDRPPTESYEIFPKLHIAPFHFPNPATGLPTRYPGGTGPAAGPPEPKPEPLRAARTIPELARRTSETERLLKIAMAYDAAENLASAYGYYLDEFMWDETADLFTRSGRRRLSSIGEDTGRELIRQSLKRRYPSQKSADYLLVHQLLQPVIHVSEDGQSAAMRVRLFQLGGPSGGNGLWIAGVYETKTALEEGIWKFSSMNLEYTWTADYRTGWAHVPAKASGIVATPFPKINDLPFHYQNPVTGRKPPVFVP